MRHALMIIALLALFGCGKDSAPSDDEPNAPEKPTSKLERPGLPKAPSGGLPDDLRPPRE